MGVLIKFSLKVLLVVLVAAFLFAYAFNRWIEPDPTGEPTALALSGKFLEVDGVNYRYLDEGTSITTYLLLHGRGNSADTWRYMMHDLAKTSRVIAPDLAGYGYSSKDPNIDFSTEARVERLHDFLTAANVKSVVLVGHEYGADLALAYAETYTDSVEQLILISPSVLQKKNTPDVFYKIPQISKAAIKLSDSDKRLESKYKKQFADPSIITEEDIAAYSAPYDVMNTFDALLAMHTQDESRTYDYTTFNIPTLIFRGDTDRFVSRADADRLAADMYDAQFVRLEDVGHLAQEEAPNLVLAEIERFMSNLKK